MVVGSFEPAPPKPPIELARRHARASAHEADNWFGLRYEHYPIVYTVKIALTIAAMLFVLPGYRQFPFRISPLAIVVGVVGVVLWIWLCQLAPRTQAPRAARPRQASSASGDRPAYNPLEATGRHARLGLHIPVIRFLGLALIVPIIEEFFLRGFLMRFVVRDDWWEVPFGKVTPLAVVVGTPFPMLMHPAELLAAARLVQPRHLADDPHQQHLGLRRRPRRHEPAARHLRRHATAVAVVVTFLPLLRERPRVVERVRASVQ